MHFENAYKNKNINLYLSEGNDSLLWSHDTTFDHQEVFVNFSVMWESTLE